MKTPLLHRVKNIFIHPRHEWQVIKGEPTTYRRIILRYVGILAVIPPAAAVAGRIILDGNIPNSALASSIVYLALTNALWYCMYIANVIIAGAVIGAILATAESRWSGVKGLKIAAYSYTPLFIAGFIAVFPKMSWIVDVAIVYSIYLLYLGILELAAREREQAIWYTVASFLSAAVIVGVMNLLEYFFESIVVNKIVF
jgi:hypothetical protein